MLSCSSVEKVNMHRALLRKARSSRDTHKLQPDAGAHWARAEDQRRQAREDDHHVEQHRVVDVLGGCGKNKKTKKSS